MPGESIRHSEKVFSSLENPFKEKRVQIQLKSKIVFEGRTCEDLPAFGYESEGVLIEAWLPNGIIINGGYFIPSANIACISPYKTRDELREMRERPR